MKALESLDVLAQGIEVRGAAPLTPLIPNAEVRFSGMWQQTEVTDPLTGEDRRFSNETDWNYSISFRQELPAWKSAWGLQMSPQLGVNIRK